MLWFNDTDRRELRSDTSLLRRDRDKPRENFYLEEHNRHHYHTRFWTAVLVYKQEC